MAGQVREKRPDFNDENFRIAYDEYPSMFTVRLHYSGHFVGNTSMEYIDGKVEMFDYCNGNKFEMGAVDAWAFRVGLRYGEFSVCVYQDPVIDGFNGFRPLKSPKNITQFVNVATQHKFIDVYFIMASHSDLTEELNIESGNLANGVNALYISEQIKKDWLGRSKVLVLSRLAMKSLLFVFDLQHNRIVEENFGGISWNMSDTLVVRDTSIYSIGFYMNPGVYKFLITNDKFYQNDPDYDEGDVDFFHLGTSVLDFKNNDNNKWKAFPKMPRCRMTLPSSAILGDNIYAFVGIKAKVYHINSGKWKNLIHPPQLLESYKSIINRYGRPLSQAESKSVRDTRNVMHPVISDTMNNRLLVNFWYDLYAYYPEECKWECLTNNKSGIQTPRFMNPAQVFDDVIYYFLPIGQGSPYCIRAYDVKTNKHIKVSWSEELTSDVHYNDSLVELVYFGSHIYDAFINLVNLGDGMMCLAKCSPGDDSSFTCFRFVRFRVKRLASPEEGVLITPATTHKFTLPTCYNDMGCVFPLEKWI